MRRTTTALRLGILASRSRVSAGGRPPGPDRRHGRTAVGRAEPGAVRGRREQLASGHHPRLVAGDVAPPARSHTGWRGSGGEAFDLLRALNTGQWGTLSTITRSAAQAFSRFASCLVAVRRRLAAFGHTPRHRHVLVHVERRHARSAVTQVMGACRDEPGPDLYVFERPARATVRPQSGVDPDRR